MIVPGLLTEDEKAVLLKLARQALTAAVNRQALPQLDLLTISDRLKKHGASFVTLTKQGELRGCIGALEAFQPLVDDVREHAAAAALDDYRFTPVQPDELVEIEIEVSYLNTPQPLDYTSPEELPGLLRPGIDGVILRDGMRRATFLPQVWEKLPDAETFLNHLCSKMGAPANLWRKKVLSVATYQVEEFHE